MRVERNLDMNYLVFIYFILTITLIFNRVGSLEDVGIVGGDRALPLQFKYLISLQRDGHHRCGGGIIDNFFILTIASCFIDITTGKFRNSNFMVYAYIENVHLTSQAVFTDQVHKVYVPKEFQDNNLDPEKLNILKADIAVAKLKNGLIIEDSILLTKLELPTELSFLLNRGIFIIAGYGFYDFVSEIPEWADDLWKSVGFTDGLLRSANVNILIAGECLDYNFSFDPVSQFCGQIEQRNRSKPEGSCLGDEGNPLVYQGRIVFGLLSRTSERCQEDSQPAFYTNVLYYSSFIISAMKNQNIRNMRIAQRKKSLFSNNYEFKEL